MKAIYKPIVLIAAAILLIFVPGNYSQSKNTYKENMVLLKVVGPDNAWAKAWVVEGQALRVYNEKTGLNFAFYPIVSRPTRKEVLVKVYRITGASPEEKLDEIERLTIPLGASKAPASECPLTIKAEAIKLHLSNISLLKASAKLTQSFGMKEESASCCIVCNGSKSCANCAIFTSCGCCNTPACAGECN